MPKNSYAGVDPIISDQVHFYANKLRRYSYFAHIPIEDLQQELMLDVCRAMQSFDKSKGGLYAFVVTVLKRHVCNMLRQQNLLKNENKHFTESLDQKLSHDGDEYVYWDVEEITDRDAFEDSETKLDIERIIARLPTKDQKILKDVMQHGKEKAAEMNGVSRTTVWRRLIKARKAFVDGGYDNFLR